MGQTASSQNPQIPPEWGHHQSTFMSWPSDWGSLNSRIQADIARIANAIVQFEPVYMMAAQKHIASAKAIVNNSQVIFVPIPVDDLWARHTLPLFLRKDKRLTGLNLNFNGMGDKQCHENDAKVASSTLDYLNLTGARSKLVSEGGAFEFDGEGTLMLTESSIVNKNRNPGLSKDEIDQILKSELGVAKIIWIKGIKGHDITDLHIDNLARFVAPGVVMVSRPFPAPEDDVESQVWIDQYNQIMSVLKTATDAKGRQLSIIELPEPNPEKIHQMSPSEIKLCRMLGVDCKNTVFASYVSFYIVNGGVIVPAFGDQEADHTARDIVQKAFLSRKVVSVNIDFIAVGGGGIHCATHQVPKL
ncbi:hypothetical protein DFQ26_007731 [Actinomortierella ambigua]|nr:hypothetical protein DFQ26_007731 [Actinomortierella ambigua]